MKHRQLPEDLRSRVRRFVQYKWLATRGVDEETILRALPADLRRDIQRHLCLDLVRRVRFLLTVSVLYKSFCAHVHNLKLNIDHTSSSITTSYFWISFSRSCNA